MNVSSYILKFKFFFKNTFSTMTTWVHVGLLQLKSEMIHLPKQVYLINIHRNTTHFLDMLCCHKHQQQSYNNENLKTCIFIRFMYADKRLLLKKPFQLYLNVLSYSIKLYKHGQATIHHITITSTHYHMHHSTSYRTFFLSLAWFWALYNGWSRVNVKFNISYPIQKSQANNFLTNIILKNTSNSVKYILKHKRGLAVSKCLR